MTSAAPLSVGINYWPASSAMRWWSRFAIEEVDRDFARIAAAGLNSVRLFLLWNDFQPAPEKISHSSLTNLVTVADLAQRHGLGIMPTLFCGHMSGVNWLPRWATQTGNGTPRFRTVCGEDVGTRGSRDWVTDAVVASAQRRLVVEVVGALRGHPALRAWDLGNENSNCWVPRSRADGRRWLGTMTDAVRGADGGALVTLGTHMEDLEEDRHIGPAEVAEFCDLLCMHGYPIYCEWATGRHDAWLCPFLGLVTGWLGGGSTDVCLQELGGPTQPSGEIAATPDGTPLLREDELADYVSAVLANLRQARCSSAMLWCANDYTPDLWDRPPLDLAVHERYFGLWRADGTAKPAVERIAQMAMSMGRPAPSSPPPAHSNMAWIDIDRATFYDAPRQNLIHLYRRFRRTLGAPAQ